MLQVVWRFSSKQLLLFLIAELLTYLYDVTGARRFHDNIELMLGFRLGRWLMVCWTILTPLVTGVSDAIYIKKQYSPLKAEMLFFSLI